MEIEKYDFAICKFCMHYKQPDNKMVCMMCMNGDEFIKEVENKMLRLKNIDHDFDVDVGEIAVTIRNGLKWSERLNIGNTIELVFQKYKGDNGVKVGEGRILGFWNGRFNTLPKSLIMLEHNRNARNEIILEKMLKTIYPDFKNDNYVTALIYIRISKIDNSI